KIILSVMLIAALAFNNCNNSTDPSQTTEPDQNDPDPTALTGEYFGQVPPGSTPVVFAPGIISVPDHFEHSAAVFSPDKGEVFWAAKPNGQSYFKFYYMKMEGGIWTDPAVAPFSGNFDINRPVFSPDGNKLYYDSGNEIWVVERQGDGWSAPAMLPSVINSGSGQRMYSIADDGSIYFNRFNTNSNLSDELEEIYVSRYVNGQFTEPERLDDNINSDYARELAVFVAPDESYMIIEESRDDTICGLFICYKMNDNSWSERIALNLGWGRFPYVSPDGRYLFFLGEEGIYWVNTSFIENLRPEERFTNLTGEYFGLTPPGSTPVVFAPEIISMPDHFEHSAAVFSPDKSEVFWSTKPNGQRFFELYYMKMIDDIWTLPEEATFNLNGRNMDRPVFSSDGNRLYFDSDGEIWVAEKSGDDWAVRNRISSVIDTDGFEELQSITSDGSIYFLRLNPDSDDFGTMQEVYVSRYIDGQYTQPDILDSNINSDAAEMAICVAQDESYMIIEETEDSNMCELFISYKMNDGSWSERIDLNLGWSRFPSVSPDGSYLFYLGEQGIYWVSTAFIEGLRPDDLK
ncbi:MAG: hypothetical protein GY863_18115, partial [bacterium]|nr:hypothetical protein [bacterium]